MSNPSAPHHYTWPVEKYSYSVSSLASANSDRSDWLHLPQRDNLYLVLKSERKLHPGQLLPTNDTMVKVVCGLQVLEEINLTDLAPRTFTTDSAARVPAIFVIGRAPCLAVKYIANDLNHVGEPLHARWIRVDEEQLRRFQVRFRLTTDYEAAKTLFERHNCPVRQRAAGGGTDSGSKVNEMCMDSLVPSIPLSQVFPSSQMQQHHQMIQMPQTSHQQQNTFASMPQTPVQMPVDKYEPATPQRISTQMLFGTQAQSGHPYTPSFQQPFRPPNYQRPIRPTPASAYDFPSDERPYTAPSAPQPTPPQTVWRSPPAPPANPEPTAPGLPNSYLDQELPPPRPPASFFGTTLKSKEAISATPDKRAADTPSILDLPPLKKPTPVQALKEQLPTPKRTPASTKRAAATPKKPKAPKPPTPKKAPAPKVPTERKLTVAGKRPPSVQVEVSDTESDSAPNSGGSKIPESNNPTPDDDDDDLDIPVATSRGKGKGKGKAKEKNVEEEGGEIIEGLVAGMAKVSPMNTDEQTEQLIIQALQDEEFGRLYEAVGRAWGKMGMGEVGRGLFEKK